MNPANRLLLDALRHPAGLTKLPPAGWDVLLPQARHAGVLARLAVCLEELGLLGSLPPKVCDHLESERAVASEIARAVRWEVNRIHRALALTGCPIVLLKGAAYLLAGLPPARGRIFSDVDVLVPREMLAPVEEALLRHGWAYTTSDSYDHAYYRRWTHELPPMQHRERESLLDVHHNIAHPTGRPLLDPSRLLADAQSLPGTCVRVLAPPDMVLHCAAHLFEDGEMGRALRDLADLNDLLKEFGAAPFWDQLVARAAEIGLQRQLFYALRYARALLGTEVPAGTMRALGPVKPGWATTALMDGLVLRTVLPEEGGPGSWQSGVARWLLEVRSLRQRMPALPLARHLLHKFLNRWVAANKGP